MNPARRSTGEAGIASSGRTLSPGMSLYATGWPSWFADDALTIFQ